MPIDPSFIPRLRAGIDLMKATISAEQALFASRIDGRTTAKDLGLLLGHSAEVACDMVRALVEASVVEAGAEATESAPKQKTARRSSGIRKAVSSAAPRPNRSTPAGDGRGQQDPDDAWQSFEIPAEYRGGPETLAEDRKRKVLYFHEWVEVWNHYEVLQISRNAEPKAVKKAYFARSKEWHPDRFGQNDLGRYRRMIERIYKHVSDAYKTLSDRKARAGYDRELPDEALVVEGDDGDVDVERSQRQLERYKKAIAERRKKRNPVRQRKQKAETYYQDALKQERSGDLTQAMRLAQIAVTYAPKNEEVTALIERLKDATVASDPEPLRQQAMQHEQLTEWPKAIEALEQALEISPDDARLRLRLAYNMLMSRAKPESIAPQARRALSGLPDDAEAHYVFGRTQEGIGDTKGARRAYERALELRPKYDEAGMRLKKLKWRI